MHTFVQSHDPFLKSKNNENELPLSKSSIFCMLKFAPILAFILFL